MPESIEAVWTSIIAIFGQNGIFHTGVDAIASVPLLMAPIYIGLAGLVIGLAKRTLRLRRR